MAPRAPQQPLFGPPALDRQFLLSNQPHLVHHIGIAVFRTCNIGSINRHIRASPHHPRLFDRRLSAIPSLRQCAARIRRRQLCSFSCARCPRDISVFLLHRIRDFARLRSSPLPSGLCHSFSMAARPKMLRCRACRVVRNTRDTPATYYRTSTS
jgi:hypothetical protein